MSLFYDIVSGGEFKQPCTRYYGATASDESAEIWEEAVVTYFKVSVIPNLPGRLENHDKA
jgi:hypothetical protein